MYHAVYLDVAVLPPHVVTVHSTSAALARTTLFKKNEISSPQIFIYLSNSNACGI